MACVVCVVCGMVCVLLGVCHVWSVAVRAGMKEGAREMGEGVTACCFFRFSHMFKFCISLVVGFFQLRSLYVLLLVFLLPFF